MCSYVVKVAGFLAPNYRLLSSYSLALRGGSEQLMTTDNGDEGRRRTKASQSLCDFYVRMLWSSQSWQRASPPSPSMKRRGGNNKMKSPNATQTWYAYNDPKTGREYFHEPVSNETSWVLPTSSSKYGGARAGGRPGRSCKDPKPVNADCGVGKRGKWSSAGVVVLSVLIGNTVFLLGLVKLLHDYNGNENALPIGRATNHVEVPHRAQEGGVEIKHMNDDVVDEIQDVTAGADSTVMLTDDVEPSVSKDEIGSENPDDCDATADSSDIDGSSGVTEDASIPDDEDAPEPKYEVHSLYDDVIPDEEVNDDEEPSQVEDEGGMDDDDDVNEKDVQAVQDADNNNVLVTVLVGACGKLRNSVARFFRGIRRRAGVVKRWLMSVETYLDNT